MDCECTHLTGFGSFMGSAWGNMNWDVYGKDSNPTVSTTTRAPIDLPDWDTTTTTTTTTTVEETTTTTTVDSGVTPPDESSSTLAPQEETTTTSTPPAGPYDGWQFGDIEKPPSSDPTTLPSHDPLTQYDDSYILSALVGMGFVPGQEDVAPIKNPGLWMVALLALLAVLLLAWAAYAS